MEANLRQLRPPSAVQAQEGGHIRRAEQEDSGEAELLGKALHPKPPRARVTALDGVPPSAQNVPSSARPPQVRKGVPYCDNRALTCSVAEFQFRVSRIPCPPNCPVKVPSTLHTPPSRNPWHTRRLMPLKWQGGKAAVLFGQRFS